MKEVFIIFNDLLEPAHDLYGVRLGKRFVVTDTLFSVTIIYFYLKFHLGVSNRLLSVIIINF